LGNINEQGKNSTGNPEENRISQLQGVHKKKNRGRRGKKGTRLYLKLVSRGKNLMKEIVNKRQIWEDIFEGERAFRSISKK